MRILTLLVLGGLLASCQPTRNDAPTAEMPEFRALFDGVSLDGWRGIGLDHPPADHWLVEDGSIRKVASGSIPRAPDGQVLEGGDLMTEETFEDFELLFEWRLAPGGNSGIKYNVGESMSAANNPPRGALGFEYQILDDSLHADRAVASHRTGSLYDLFAAPDAKPFRPAGSWNESRLLWRDGRGEHWLNGERVVSFDVSSARFDSALAASKYASIDGFADLRAGHIVLQDHGDDVWYRNLFVRTDFGE